VKAIKQSIRTLVEAHRGQNKRMFIPCPVCGEPFLPKRKTQKFDSPNCRKRAWDEKKIIETAIKALQLVRENKYGIKG